MGIGPADEVGQEVQLSSNLLRNVGEFFHGQEWQAPLARDLEINERTMRRWVAGTEIIPRGVWSDLGRKMEMYHQTLAILLGEVKRASGTIAGNVVQTVWEVNSMRSEIFKDHGFPDADYDFDAGRDGFNQPVVNFRAPGHGLQMIDLNGASQIRQKLQSAGDAEGARLFERLINDAQRGLVTTAPLYVDASRAAQMDHGARTDNFYTLQEAKMAWDRLPEDRREIATITSAGRVYERSDIERLHYQRSA